MTEMYRRTGRVLAVTSGKGGVGKTSVAVNLAVALAAMGRRTMLVDHDLGLGDANILLGIEPTATIADLIEQNCGLEAVLHPGPAGMSLVPGYSGAGLSPVLGASARTRLARAFRPFAGAFDQVILDTPSGIAPDALATVAASDLVLLVLGPEPTAFMDAYALVKVLALRHGCTRVAVVANLVDDDQAGRILFDRFRGVAARFLAVTLEYLGAVPHDDHLPASVFRKRACVEVYPGSRASTAFGRIARGIVARNDPATAAGNRFFAMEAPHGAC